MVEPNPKAKNKQTTQTTFLMSVLISSIAVGLLVVPAGITGKMLENGLPNWACQLCSFSAHVAVTASILSQAGLAVLRVTVVRFSKQISFNKTNIFIGIIWTFSFLYSIPTPFTHKMVTVTRYDSMFKMCAADTKYQIFKTLLIVDFVVLFVIPLTIICVSYGVIIHGLFSQSYQSHHGEVANQNRVELKQFLKLFIALLVCFILCQLPARVYSFVIHILNVQQINTNIANEVVSLWAYCNAIFNPLAALAFSASIRKHAKELTCARKTVVVDLMMDVKSYE